MRRSNSCFAFPVCAYHTRQARQEIRTDLSSLINSVENRFVPRIFDERRSRPHTATEMSRIECWLRVIRLAKLDRGHGVLWNPRGSTTDFDNAFTFRYQGSLFLGVTSAHCLAVKQSELMYTINHDTAKLDSNMHNHSSPTAVSPLHPPRPVPKQMKQE